MLRSSLVSRLVCRRKVYSSKLPRFDSRPGTLFGDSSLSNSDEDKLRGPLYKKVLPEQSHSNLQKTKYNKIIHQKIMEIRLHLTTGKICDYIKDLIPDGRRHKEETKKESKLL